MKYKDLPCIDMALNVESLMEIEGYKKQVGTLQNQMKHWEMQNDALRTLNSRLTKRIHSLQNQLLIVENDNELVRKENIFLRKELEKWTN
ncbi:hypothetical protein [Bacillus cereus]|uniref:hypothetical protein n=1 Tax=Bacillus cereus TaxID=1396 RepID=UPI000BF6E951|nr:hypothetical protein [Bacillus cereus]PFN61714.1 hypothetical protein COJ64_29945 [Bacillus cereus]